MRLLVIEDEKKTREYLAKGLRESGFVVDAVEDGETGLHLACSEGYDLIILDVMLPGRDGWSVVREMRRVGKQTPTLFLTARDAIDDRVKGLELGADDYIPKPFAYAELLARVRALLRRGPGRQPERLCLSDLELDLVRHKASRSGQTLELSPKEFALLSLLMRRSGEVLTRTLIASQVWDINFDSGTNLVEVSVGRLRRKVDDPFEQKLIHTVRGVGYVLEER